MRRFLIAFAFACLMFIALLAMQGVTMSRTLGEFAFRASVTIFLLYLAGDIINDKHHD